MSELKAISGHEIREDIDYNTRGIDPENKEWRNYGKELCDTLYYRKSEADAVIAQLNDKARHYPMMALIIEEAKRDLLRQAKEILHHKYKRCLAIVETCIYKKELDEDRYHMHGGHGWTNYRFWDKWQKTWLKLAEQFKDKEA